MKRRAAMFDSMFIRFAAVGVLNALVGYLIYGFMLWLGLGYALAAAFATVLGVCFNFQSTGRLVFGANDNRLVTRFIGVYVVVYLVNVGCLTLLTGVGFTAYTAGLVTLLPAALLGFFLNKKFVFRVTR